MTTSATLTSTYRDFLVTQGSGISDGAYADAEICHAYRGTSGSGQGDVVYSNGSGAVALGGSGQWAHAVANACICSVGGGGGPGKILYAPSEADDPAYRAAISAAAGGATVDYFDASTSTPRTIAAARTTTASTRGPTSPTADSVAFGNNLADLRRRRRRRRPGRVLHLHLRQLPLRRRS